MLTGIDINIAVCRSEGYPVVHHGKSSMNPQKEYRLTISNPKCWTDSGQVKFASLGSQYRIDNMFSYVELWNIFTSAGSSIKKYCDYITCPIPDPNSNPSFNDFVTLANNLQHYVGLY